MTKQSRSRAKAVRKAAKIEAKRIKMIKHGVVHVELPRGAQPAVLVDPVKPHVVSVVALPPKKEAAVGFWASLFGTNPVRK